MQILESIRMAWQSLITNKLRSALTLLGISIGLFTIIMVMTSIRAIQNSVEEVFEQLGSNNLVIQKYPAIQVGHGFSDKYRNRKDLTLKQGEKLKNLSKLPVYVGLTRNQSGKIVKYGNNSTNPEVNILGTDLDGMATMEMEIERGRSLSQSDMDFGRNVCVVGKDIAEKLFTSLDPIGREIKVDGMVLEIVGVAKEIGSVMGQSQDNFVALPLSVYIKTYGKISNYEYVIRAPENRIMETIEEITNNLRIIRKVNPIEENDFEILTNEQLISQFNDLTKYFKMGSAIIAFIALVAAGVGIMNIMLVSVTERTREIGIRKAIGAKKLIIRAQFILEAIVLSQIGGIIGIILGVVGGNIVAAVLGVSVAVPIDWIVLGLLITSSVGLVFGSYPAIKASNLDPIEALRYE